MLDMTPMPDPVAAAFGGLGNPAALFEARDLIFAEATRLGIAPIEETLKWGQPSYLPPKRLGTTIRLGLLAGQPAIFVHCQTSIIADARELFGGVADFKDNRALVLGGDARAAAHVVCAALTYHRRR